jgi:hypothetical protein
MKVTKAEFINPMDIRRQCPVDSDRNFILLAPLGYKSLVLNDVVVVPIGFTTDFASVPRAPLIFWLCGDTSTEASVVHDYLYTTKQYSRAQADAVLREASLVSKVPRWRAWLMWAGVRVFGGSHWA